MNVNGSVTLKEIAGDLRLGLVRSRRSNVTLTAAVAILDTDAAGDSKVAGADPQDVQGDNITLTALTGSVGTESDFVESNLDDAISTIGFLDADAHLGVYVEETANDLRLGLVCAGDADVANHPCEQQTATGTVTDAALVSRHGSILDAADAGLTPDPADIIAVRIDLKAATDIGAPTNDLEINSSTARLHVAAGSTRRRAATSTSPRRETSSSCSPRSRRPASSGSPFPTRTRSAARRSRPTATPSRPSSARARTRRRRIST